MTGKELESLRILCGINRLTVGDEVNYSKGGLFTILAIDWYTGECELHTRGKHESHHMYKRFWCYIEDVCLAGTFTNTERTSNEINERNKTYIKVKKLAEFIRKNKSAV